jgi:hypothetical protein
MRQFAPLLIGRGPVRILTESQTGIGGIGAAAAGMFVLLLIGLWTGGWWLAREDRRFIDRTRTNSFSLPAGTSLNDLELGSHESTGENR